MTMRREEKGKAGRAAAALLLAGFANLACAGPEATEVWDPEPPVVAPGVEGAAPSDAFALFDGTDLAAWQHEDGSAAKWKVRNGWFEVLPGSGDIETRRDFGDIQLHLEWQAPLPVTGDGQGRGNSGVFLQQRYEVQVLDSYQNRTYSNGQAASIYKQHIPLVNATTAPGTWQSYDILYKAPRFSDDGSLRARARVTVLHNGILVQDDVEIKGTTVYEGEPEYAAHPSRDALRLQDHDNPVRFRNIWVRPLGN
jgi:hypothetical protein